MTLRRLLQILAAHMLTMAASVVAVVVLVGVVIAVVPPKYTATASVVVSNMSTDPVGGLQTQTGLGCGDAGQHHQQSSCSARSRDQLESRQRSANARTLATRC